MSQAIERLNDMMNHQPAFRAFPRSTCLRVEPSLAHPRGCERSTERRLMGESTFRASLLVLSLVFTSLLTACAALPRQPTERALYIDARKALNGESRLGWTVDRVEIAEAATQTEP